MPVFNQKEKRRSGCAKHQAMAVKTIRGSVVVDMKKVLIYRTMGSHLNYWMPDFGSMENKSRRKQGLSCLSQIVGESVGDQRQGSCCKNAKSLTLARSLGWLSAEPTEVEDVSGGPDMSLEEWAGQGAGTETLEVGPVERGLG